MIRIGAPELGMFSIGSIGDQPVVRDLRRHPSETQITMSRTP